MSARPPLVIENARPGHLALVRAVEDAAVRHYRAMAKFNLDPQASGHLDEARRELLALLRAQEEALEDAAEREKGRAALREAAYRAHTMILNRFTSDVRLAIPEWYEIAAMLARAIEASP